MRNTLLFMLFFTLFCASATAQISLNSSNFIQEATTYKMCIPTTNSFDLEATGPNSIWDFSALQVDSTIQVSTHSLSEGGIVVNFQFGMFAPEKYQADYFQKYDAVPIDALSQFGNILPISIEAMNQLVKITDDKITYPGYTFTVNGQQIGFKSDEIETGYQFPMTYGDSYSSDAYTNFDFSLVYDAQIKQYRHHTITVDGYGKIVLPYSATFQVIRIHHHITELDSVRLNLFGTDMWFAIPRTLDDYEWRTTAKKYPILKIETESFLGNSFTKRVTYYETPVPHGTRFFPNPAFDEFKIQSDEGIEKIIIYNLQGQQMKQVNISSVETTVDVSSLAPGRYSIQTIAKNGTKYYPLIIQ